jgi:hypothetical protein
VTNESFGPYIQALQFTEAMLRGFDTRRDSGAAISCAPAAFASGAFAAELHLKALMIATARRKRSHHLEELFMTLPEQVRSAFLAAYSAYTRDPPMMGVFKLKVMAAAFEQWRYVYEDPSLVNNTDQFALFGLIYAGAHTYRAAGYAPGPARAAEASTMRWLMNQSPFMAEKTS